jgi:hypothetical protein
MLIFKRLLLITNSHGKKETVIGIASVQIKRKNYLPPISTNSNFLIQSLQVRVKATAPVLNACTATIGTT